MFKKDVLFIDNDVAYMTPFLSVLHTEGFNVTVARTISDAEELLTEDLSLIILDVMIPVTERELTSGYSADVTSDGLKTGLAFYRRHRDFIARHSIPLIVLTVRIDSGIADDFVAAGLAPSAFLTKYEVRDAQVFLNSVIAAIGDRVQM